MRQTPHAINELRTRALALGIVWDELPPLLRVHDIVRRAKTAGGPRGGILPLSARTFYSLVAAGLVEPPVKFQDGISAWRRETIIRLALDGIPRPPGHGRKLSSREVIKHDRGNKEISPD